MNGSCVVMITRVSVSLETIAGDTTSMKYVKIKPAKVAHVKEDTQESVIFSQTLEHVSLMHIVDIFMKIRSQL